MSKLLSTLSTRLSTRLSARPARRTAVRTAAALGVTATLVLGAGTTAVAAPTRHTPSTTTTPKIAPVVALHTATAVNALALARSFAGVRYVYGGTTPRGFDCSGLVQYVYRHLGISLPRTAEEQWAASRHITRAQLRPGDLVFYGGPGYVHHVGIYAGGNRMWNAPHTGSYVRLQPLFAGSKLYGRVLPGSAFTGAGATPVQTALGTQPDGGTRS